MSLEQQKLDSLIERVKLIFPGIVDEYNIETNNNKNNSTQRYAILNSSDGDGIDLKISNISVMDVRRLVDDSFSDESLKLDCYFNLLYFYSRLLNDHRDDSFQLYLHVFSYSDKSQKVIVQSLATKDKTFDFWFDGYSAFQKIDFINVSDTRTTFCIDLENSYTYDSICYYLNKKVKEYIDLDSISSLNFENCCNLIKMIKI